MVATYLTVWVSCFGCLKLLTCLPDIFSLLQANTTTSSWKEHENERSIK